MPLFVSVAYVPVIAAPPAPAPVPVPARPQPPPLLVTLLVALRTEPPVPPVFGEPEPHNVFVYEQVQPVPLEPVPDAEQQPTDVEPDPAKAP